MWTFIGVNLPLVLGDLTRDDTGTPCSGDVISLTCTVPVDGPQSFFEWDIPDLMLVRIDRTTEVPFQRDQYTITSVVVLIVLLVIKRRKGKSVNRRLFAIVQNHMHLSVIF